MKNFLLILSIPFILMSCYKDKGNYDYMDSDKVTIMGIKDSYTCNFLEEIDINPEILSEKNEEYDCMWIYYDKNDLKKKIDTLSTEKHLDKKIDLPLSSYQLIFAYKNKNTGVTKYFDTNLIVQSPYFSGWYVLKEKNNNADLDLFYNDKADLDLLLNASGKAIEGSPLSLDFTKFSFVENEELIKGNLSFAVLTEEKVNILRISDMKILAEHEDLFFEEAPKCIPNIWYSSSEENGFVNNGKLYAYSERDGELGASKFSFSKNGDYQLSEVFTKNATMSPLLFDLKHGKFCTAAKSSNNIIFLEDEEQSLYKNEFMGYKPIYFGFLDEGMWEGGKMYAVLEKESDKSRHIIYIDSRNLVYYEDSFLKNGITNMHHVSSSSHFEKASSFAQNRKFEMMYFSDKDKLYSFNHNTKTEYEVKCENGQPAIPSGEVILMMKHIVFDWYDYMDPTQVEYVDKLVVATSNGDNYKLYLLETIADKVKNNPKVYEGTGKPVQAFYMSPHFNNPFICY